MHLPKVLTTPTIHLLFLDELHVQYSSIGTLSLTVVLKFVTECDALSLL
jgi:hypothetical protein